MARNIKNAEQEVVENSLKTLYENNSKVFLKDVKPGTLVVTKFVEEGMGDDGGDLTIYELGVPYRINKTEVRIASPRYEGEFDYNGALKANTEVVVLGAQK